ncbi:MAG: CDC48 family AAA ATPase [Deltaproteobacteria bacterium]|nr:CDC48 family AAA ATPase [Deltaproteobacteria bacterium]
MAKQPQLTDKERTVKLKVAEAQQQDVGKGVARISRLIWARLGLDQEDILEIRGKRTTAAIAMPAYVQDEGLDIIRMDGLMRANAKVGIGDAVEVARARWQEGKRVVLAPAKKGLRLEGAGESLRPTLLRRPVVQGDLISTSVFHHAHQAMSGEVFPESFFRSFFESPAFGLQEIRLVVAATTPRGTVRVTESTEIEISPEYLEVEALPKIPEVTYEDIGGIKPIIQKVREMIELPLKHPELFDRLGIEAPKGVLLYGTPGTGKTLLAKAVAHESEATFLPINGPEIMSKFYGESEQRLRETFSQAEANPPAIIFIDELDSIAPRRQEVTGEVERRVVAQLLTLMDGLKARRHVIVIAATNRIEAIDPALRRPGRFDREIELPVPDEAGRREILEIHTRGMPLGEGVNLEEIAARTYGHVGSDLGALCREAAMHALRRVLPNLDMEEKTVPPEVLAGLVVTREDFEASQQEVHPSAMREIMVERPRVHWTEIGGLAEVKQLLREAVELPLTHADSFRRLGISAPKGILLYGPPGTGKTLLAKAVATESRANFISAKGSDVLSKWFGETERRIAEIFTKARQVAPAVVFFDELDSLAPVRGSGVGEPHVVERMVNQLLAEMDGLEELRGVVVLGASNRPDIVDPALLRPGRFDEIIYVPIPDRDARRDIFKVHMAKMVVGEDVALEELVGKTERFTGADIAAVCKKAGRLALRESLEAQTVGKRHFLAAIAETTPSVTPEMERRYQELIGKLKQQAAPGAGPGRAGQYL